MPQSIPIAAFAFGAVLLLIALLGGKFKLFGAEVSGTAGRAGRSVAAILGIALIVIGLVIALQTADRGSGPQPSTSDSDKSSRLGTPTIVSFQATPSQIKEGDTAQLQWAVQDASSVTIAPEIGEVPLSGSRTISPKATTAYALHANRGSATVQATAEVTVVKLTWEDKNSVGALAGDAINSFRVLSYASDSLVAELSYRYNPQHGQVWIGSYLLDENGQSISSGFWPAEASATGTTSFKVGVDPARGPVRSKWVYFWLYESNKGEGFVSRRFPYEHSWN